MADPVDLYLEYRSAMSKADANRLLELLEINRSDGDLLAPFLDRLIRSGHALLIGDPSEAIEHANAAKAVALDMNDLRCVIRAQMNLIRAYQDSHDAPTTLQLAFETMHLNEEIREPNVLGSLLNTIGLVYRETGDYPSALTYLQKALDEFTRLDQRNFIANGLCNIGGLYYYLDRNEEAARFLEQGIEMQREVGNKEYEISQTMALAKVYGSLGRTEEGLLLLRSMLHAAQEHELTSLVATATTDLARHYVFVGEHEEALSTLDAYREIIDKFPISMLERDTIYASALANLGRYDESKAIIHNAMELCRSRGFKGFVQNFHRLLRDIAKEQGDFDAYIEHNDAQQKLTEEMKGAEASRKIAMIESEKKILQLQQERDRERAVLYSALPKHVADRVIRGDTVSDQFTDAAVLFADIVGFTKHSSAMSAAETAQLLEDIFTSFDEICRSHGVVKVKTIGDSYLCFRGDGTATENVVSLMKVAMSMLESSHTWPDNARIHFRIGAHVGPLTAGVIGTERLQYDIWGDTVNVASRMESTGEPGRIHVSEQFASFLAAARNDSSPLVTNGEGTVIPRAKPEERGDSSQIPVPWSLRERGAIEVKGKGRMLTYWLSRQQE